MNNQYARASTFLVGQRTNVDTFICYFIYWKNQHPNIASSTSTIESTDNCNIF